MANIEERDFQQLMADVKRILTYLENDESTGRKGIFHDVEENKKRLQKIEDRQKAQRAIVTFLSVIGGFLFWVLREVYVYFVK